MADKKCATRPKHCFSPEDSSCDPKSWLEEDGDRDIYGSGESMEVLDEIVSSYGLKYDGSLTASKAYDLFKARQEAKGDAPK